jgi:hypothetical protein
VVVVSKVVTGVLHRCRISDYAFHEKSWNTHVVNVVAEPLGGEYTITISVAAVVAVFGILSSEDPNDVELIAWMVDVAAH